MPVANSRRLVNAHDFATTAPPDFRLDARAAQPLAPLTSFLASFAGRVLIAADSPGRREVIAEMLAAHGRRPRAVQTWQQFADGDAPLAINVAEDMSRPGPDATRRCCC